jgi:hypothetical protein
MTAPKATIESRKARDLQVRLSALLKFNEGLNNIQ